MVVNRKAPHGTVYALEVLEMVLISAAFDQDVSMRFHRRWRLPASPAGQQTKGSK